MSTAEPVHGNEETISVILFTDLEGHTEMVSRLGDAKGRDVLREHEQRIRLAINLHDGVEKKAMGDGFMVQFRSVSHALRCAVKIQESFEQPVIGEVLKVRAGIQVGEPVEEDGDLFGASVIAAARICAVAHGGEILVSGAVREIAVGSEFDFADQGARRLKGLPTEIHLWSDWF